MNQIQLQKRAEALRAKLAPYVSLDAAEGEKANFWADLGVGMLPIVGTAQAGRDFERARREDSKLGMGLASLGLIPVVGKPAATGAKAVAKAIPKAVRELGETKAKREAATAATQAEQVGQTFEKQAGAGKREKVAPDKYRRLYEEQGTPAVTAAARAGEHLKPAPGGGYVGGPRTVKTEAQLQALRGELDAQLANAGEALEFADPQRVGNWYDRAKTAQASSSENYQLPRNLEQTAVYSAGVAPESELAFALKHRNQEVLGTGERAYREAGKRTLDTAVAENRPAKLAPKVGEYRGKNDPRRVEASPFGVNDFRMAQAFHYTDPKGAPWRAGASATMHPFMDAETALMVDRANAARIGGRADWTGAQTQELPWILNKAEDIYGRGKKGRFSPKKFGGDETAGKVAALREANKTIADFIPKHTMSVTHEATPGLSSGHRADVLEMPFEQRAAYGKQGSWTRPAPENAAGFAQKTPFGEVGAGDRDVLYSALGFRQMPAIESVGNYRNSAGVVEQNPLTISRPLADFATGTQQQVNPNTLKTMRAAEVLRGVIDAQENVAANLPVTMAGRKGKTGLLLERGTPPTREEMGAINAALEGTPYAGNVSATDRGLAMFDFGAGKKGQRRMLKQSDALRAALPGSELQKADFESLYEPAISTAEEAGQGIATTRALQAFADAPDEAALAIGESEGVRKAIREKIARDTGAAGTREDIQKTRQFFSEADWPRAVAMMKKGMTPAAALAALGYSMSGMAAENE